MSNNNSKPQSNPSKPVPPNNTVERSDNVIIPISKDKK